MKTGVKQSPKQDPGEREDGRGDEEECKRRVKDIRSQAMETTKNHPKRPLKLQTFSTYCCYVFSFCL